MDHESVLEGLGERDEASSPQLDRLRAELKTHGVSCKCGHKKMCEDREEGLRAEIWRLSA